MKKKNSLNAGNKKFDFSSSSASIDLIKSKNILVNSYLICNCLKDNTTLKSFINKLEEEFIKKALLIANGNQRTAASILGMKPTTFNEKMKKFGIKKIEKTKTELNFKTLLKEDQYFLFDIENY